MPFSETAKIRPYIWNYVKDGKGIDLGCEFDKVHPHCIGMDRIATFAIDIQGNITDLSRFKDNHFDWVFSSHAIEDIPDTHSTLKEWLRVLTDEGNLIIYCPYRMWYPNVGQPGANANHVHDFIPSDLVKILRDIHPDIWIVTAEIRGHKRTNEFEEYSCLVIARKKAPQNPNILIHNNHQIGDTISASPLCKTLKSLFPTCQITIAHDVASVMDKSLVDHIGKNQNIAYDLIVHQNVGSTENGDYWRRASHFTQFTTRVCGQLLPKVSDSLPSDMTLPIPIEYGVLPTDLKGSMINVIYPDFDKGNFVAVCADTYPPRQWVPDNWQNIIDFIKSKGYDVIILGLDNSITFKNAIDTRRQLSFRESVAVLSKAKLLVSVDTSFVHFAEFVGVPSIALMGPSRAETTFYPSTTTIYRGDQGCVGCYNWQNRQNQFEWKDGKPEIPTGDRYLTGEEMPLYVLNECKNYMMGVQCMRAITIDQVQKAISMKLS